MDTNRVLDHVTAESTLIRGCFPALLTELLVFCMKIKESESPHFAS
jgi:hypothetical protein